MAGVAPWSEPGDILRWWRSEILGWSQQQLAVHLSVGSSTVSNWENGSRQISLDLVALDGALDAGGVLVALLQAVGTTRGLAPGRVWTKVFPGPSTPVWMWVRSRGRALTIEGEWGVVSVQTEVTLEPNGLFVTVGGSVADSPVVVQLSSPGWADFGRGVLPGNLPEAQIIAAIDHVRPSSAQGVFMDLFVGDLGDRLQRFEPEPGTGGAGLPADPLAAFAHRYARATPHRPAGPWPPVPDGADSIERSRFAALRKARGLSLNQTVERLAVETGVACSRDTLRRFEMDRGEPFDRSLPAALDHVLGAEGHLALTTLRTSSGPGTVSIPFFWHGPVWIAVDSPGAEVTVELRWAKWARVLTGGPPLLLISHYADPSAPLRILCAPGTEWTVGLGRPAGALPINHGWAPVSVEAAQEALQSTRAAILDALSGTGDNS